MRNKKKFEDIPTPFYIVYEEKLRRNLELIKHVADEAGVDIIMALKANALWRTFPIIREYIGGTTASSVYEMQLSLDYMKREVHSYCPVYQEATFSKFLAGCTHITFNTLAQFNKFKSVIEAYHKSVTYKHISPGLRVNPQCPVIETDLYNPCLPGSRFGMTADQLGDILPDGIEGFHFHALCESTSYDLEKVIDAFESQFGKFLPYLKWVNMGGGHLMTREGYDTEHLIKILRDFKKRHPNLRVILEPGSAFTWRTGDLVASVLDITENSGIRTAIIDASFACHMPDCLEMPYKPAIVGTLPDDSTEGIPYRIGGNSCLSGDFCGDWKFEEPLKAGDRLIFEDMNHYTTVKTHMFNGIHHPAIWLQNADGTNDCLRRFSYTDYKMRMD